MVGCPPSVTSLLSRLCALLLRAIRAAMMAVTHDKFIRFPPFSYFAHSQLENRVSSLFYNLCSQESSCQHERHEEEKRVQSVCVFRCWKLSIFYRKKQTNKKQTSPRDSLVDSSWPFLLLSHLTSNIQVFFFLSIPKLPKRRSWKLTGGKRKQLHHVRLFEDNGVSLSPTDLITFTPGCLHFSRWSFKSSRNEKKKEIQMKRKYDCT